MGGNRAQVNKPHKSRFSSKATRQQHKTSLTDRSKVTKNNVAKGARTARLQRSKMIREQKRAAVLQDKRALSGSKSPPRVVVPLGLSASADLNPLAEDLLSLLTPGASSSTVASSEYKFRATVLKAPYSDLQSCMEMAKVADIIAFVVSASYYIEGSTSLYIDSFGSECLSVLRSLGLPSTAVLIRVWFKPVDVWMKCGRRGRIKEPVGTHGVMKCVLNGVLQPHDTVCMSLYKRVYPKWPEHLFPLLDA